MPEYRFDETTPTIQSATVALPVVRNASSSLQMAIPYNAPTWQKTLVQSRIDLESSRSKFAALFGRDDFDLVLLRSHGGEDWKRLQPTLSEELNDTFDVTLPLSEETLQRLELFNWSHCRPTPVSRFVYAPELLPYLATILRQPAKNDRRQRLRQLMEDVFTQPGAAIETATPHANKFFDPLSISQRIRWRRWIFCLFDAAVRKPRGLFLESVRNHGEVSPQDSNRVWRGESLDCGYVAVLRNCVSQSLAMIDGMLSTTASAITDDSGVESNTSRETIEGDVSNGQTVGATADGRSTPRQDGKPTVQPKRSTQKGEGLAKCIAALTKHHKYADGSCLNWEPIGNNKLSRLAGVVESTASEFFKSKFGGHVQYRRLCEDVAGLIAALKTLNGEFSPLDFMGRLTESEPTPELDKDE